METRDLTLPSRYSKWCTFLAVGIELCYPWFAVVNVLINLSGPGQEPRQSSFISTSTSSSNTQRSWEGRRSSCCSFVRERALSHSLRLQHVGNIYPVRKFQVSWLEQGHAKLSRLLDMGKEWMPRIRMCTWIFHWMAPDQKQSLFIWRDATVTGINHKELHVKLCKNGSSHNKQIIVIWLNSTPHEATIKYFDRDRPLIPCSFVEQNCGAWQLGIRIQQDRHLAGTVL